MDRPRRSTRTVTIKTEAEVPPPPVAGVKRKKPQVKEDKKSIDYILTNPSSPLVSLELSVCLFLSSIRSWMVIRPLEITEPRNMVHAFRR